jgi:hypothetical protein
MEAIILKRSLAMHNNVLERPGAIRAPARPSGPSGLWAWQQGRKLILKFAGSEAPQLRRIEFRFNQSLCPTYWHQGDRLNSFTWQAVSQAIAVIFLEYLCAKAEHPAEDFEFCGERRGSMAASLGDAIAQNGHRIHKLLAEPSESSPLPARPKPNELLESTSCVRQLFAGLNLHGKEVKERRISVSSEFLPPECIEVFWEIHGRKPLHKPEHIRELLARIRKSLGIEPESVEEGIPEKKSDTSVPAQATTKAVPAAQAPAQEVSQQHEPRESSEAPGKGEQLALQIEVKSLGRLTEVQPVMPQPDLKKNPEPPPARTLFDFPEIDKWKMNIVFHLHRGLKPEEIFSLLDPASRSTTTLERMAAYCDVLFRLAHPMDGAVAPEFFELRPSEYVWPHDMPVWAAWDGKQEEIWTLDDVCEGCLVLGATGSGKSSASGRAIAQGFLAKKFGALILTTKPGEGREWAVLCDVMGRGQDVSWVRHDGPLKLNLLAYETQRPGVGGRLTENLKGFFRVLLSVMASRHGERPTEAFWKQAGDQILGNLFEVFLLGNTTLGLDRLAEFVGKAPQSERSIDNTWQSIPVFGQILAAAERGAATDSQKRTFEKNKAYWLSEYPKLPAGTRACIRIGFTAMMDVLRGEHMYDLFCTQTTFVPEWVFNGRILILDLPVNEFKDAGVLFQTAVKYLLQRAIQRRLVHDDLARPVAIFADEAQNFFTEDDATFQQTARSSRVATVYLSQNLDNFYAHLGGGNLARHLFDSLAGNLNTKIFHANGNFTTEKYASDLIGTWDRPIASSSTTTHPYKGLNPFGSEPPTRGRNLSTRLEPLVPPHEFAELRNGGKKNDFITEAYIHRVGAKFNQTGRAVIKAMFKQWFVVEKPLAG